MALSNTARWALGVVASVAFAGGVTSIALRSVEPAPVAFVADSAQRIGVLTFVNTAVNNAMRPNPECLQGACSLDFEPRLAGRADCKNNAAYKLQELLLAGFKADEFDIWFVEMRAADNAGHAVLLHKPTGLVLDSNSPHLLTRHQLRWTYRFKGACETCAIPAIRAAEAIRPSLAVKP